MSRWVQAAVTNVRYRRKCYSTTGSWLLLLTTLLVFHIPSGSSTSVSSTEDKAPTYPDVDNVEWHHVRVVDGVMEEKQHPIIMYKEDFVNEDYESKDSLDATTERPVRKYKDITRHRHRQNKTKNSKRPLIKSEKVYFDIMPMPPIVMDDNDSKIDTSKVHIDIIPMVDSTEESDDIILSKQELSKRPKKYRRRMRRDTRAKRNPSLQYSFGSYNPTNHIAPQLYDYYFYHRPKNHVQGNLWNGIDRPVPTSAPIPMSINHRFGDINEEDRVVWDRFQSSTPRAPLPVQTRPSIFHNSDPKDADFSFMTRLPAQRPVPVTTMRPLTKTTPSIFHDSNPENADFSFLTRGPGRRVPTTTTTTIQPAVAAQRPVSDVASGVRTETPVTACVWAIVNCCSSRDQNVRSYCFEDHGCSGSFFDLNPCGDYKDKVIEYVSDVIN